VGFDAGTNVEGLLFLLFSLMVSIVFIQLLFDYLLFSLSNFHLFSILTLQIACAQNQIHVARVLERYVDTSANAFVLLKFANFGFRTASDVSRGTGKYLLSFLFLSCFVCFVSIRFVCLLFLCPL
jgi:hypothetical protein